MLKYKLFVARKRISDQCTSCSNELMERCLKAENEFYVKPKARRLSRVVVCLGGRVLKKEILAKALDFYSRGLGLIAPCRCSHR